MKILFAHAWFSADLLLAGQYSSRCMNRVEWILIPSLNITLFNVFVCVSVSKVAFEIVTFRTFSDNSKNPSRISMKFGHMVENNFYGISEKYDFCPITDRNYF